MPAKFRGVTAGKRQGEIRWVPDKPDRAIDFRKVISDPLAAVISERARAIARAMTKYAKERYPWTPQPEDRRGGYLGPHAHIGLFGGVIEQKSGVVIFLTHGPNVKSPRKNFPYGIALENFDYTPMRVETDGQGKYAIINPTLEEFHNEIIASLDGAINEAVKKRSRGRKRRG